MTVDGNTRSDEKVYAVGWDEAGDQRSDEVTARNAGEAVWLIHARHGEPAGTDYKVAPIDETEPARNFTVGHPRQEAPFST